MFSPERQSFYKKFAAIAIGNVMEWFDFAAFGTLADVIGAQFFPPGTNEAHLLESLTVFGAAFVMRPLGGIFLGWIGDTVGRKRALEISIAMMLLPSFLIGCLPTYQMIGWWSTFFLMILRMTQGLAVGGELIGAFVYTIEATNGQNRGFWGGSCKATGVFGSALGMGVGTLLRLSLTKDQLYAWGWRIPFFIGLIFGFIGIHLRSKLNKEGNCEGNEFQEVQNNHTITKNPLCQALHTYYREIICVGLVSSFWGVIYYSSFVWLVYFMSNESLIGGNPVPNIWILTFVMNVLLVFVMPMCGYFGDLLGQYLHDEDKGFRMGMQIGLFFALATAIPAFMLISTRTTSGTMGGMFLLLLITAMFGSNLPAFMIGQFPPNLRYSAVGIAYNIANAVFSSTAALIQTALVVSAATHQQQQQQQAGQPGQDTQQSTTGPSNDGRLRPAYYIMSVACLSLLVLTFGVDYCTRKRKEEIEMAVAKTLHDMPTLLSHDEEVGGGGGGRDSGAVTVELNEGRYLREIVTVTARAATTPPPLTPSPVPSAPGESMTMVTNPMVVHAEVAPWKAGDDDGMSGGVGDGTRIVDVGNRNGPTVEMVGSPLTMGGTGRGKGNSGRRYQKVEKMDEKEDFASV